MKESILDLKRKMLIREAERFLEIATILGDSEDLLVRKMLAQDTELKGNWNLKFIKDCVKAVDDFFDKTHPGHKRSSLEYQPNMMRMWQDQTFVNKKVRPTPGDLLIMHYTKQGKHITSGQLGIITGADRDMSIRTIEACVPNHFENETMKSQKTGIIERVRHPKGAPTIQLLGCFSPWMEI